MRHHYRRRSFSSWAFWTTSIVGVTLYGAYRFDWFPIGLIPHAAAPKGEQASGAPAKTTKGQPPSEGAIPNGHIEIAESAQSPPGQSEPPPTEFDDSPPPADHSAKARLMSQRAQGLKPKLQADATAPAPVQQSSFDDLDAKSPQAVPPPSAPKPATATASVVPAAHAVDRGPVITDAALTTRLETIDQALRSNDLLKAHRELSTVYWSKPQWRPAIQERIAKTAKAVYFDPQLHFLEPYVVGPNDQFAKIAKPYNVPWEYLAKLNHVDPKRIRPGQRLKVIKGPFSAIVELNNFVLTVHAYGYFVRAYRIGIGKDGQTPLGKLTVINKVVNPQYTDPDGRVIESGDPNNPIGKRWIDLGNSYGIHGTIDPDSIGKAESRGCIRMRNEDVEEVFDMLSVGSEVSIRG
jgi:LysM repeat protein